MSGEIQREMGAARAQIVQAYAAAVARCAPGQAVGAALERQGERLRVGERWVELARFRRRVLLGAGKAAGPMARAVEVILGGWLDSGVVVTKTGHGVALDRVELLEASHPVPDASSEAAGRRLLDEAARLGDGDLLLCVISGGASSLIEVPVEGRGLEGLQREHEEWLRSGLSIDQLNAERTRISAIKGGKLAQRAGGAVVVTLVLSDVVGHGAEVVGSGPTIRGVAGDMVVVVGDHTVALEEAARSLGSVCEQVTAAPGWLSGGDARELGSALTWAEIARLAGWGPGCGRRAWVASGEATVRVRGGGRGGRDQELALAAALALEGSRGVSVGVLATDGQDGPTDAAGAVVDGATAGAMRALGLWPERLLDTSDAYAALEAVGALVKTGPTRTNVNDLLVVLVEPWAAGPG